MAKRTLYNSMALPWYIYDIYNGQLITTPTIPLGDISDSKQIIMAETPVVGLNFNPIATGGGGNRKISFTIPLLKKNNEVGNIALVKQFENLRNVATGLNISNLFSGKSSFSSNPKVLYHWGTSNYAPLEYFVARCEFNHKSSFVNRYGHTQYTEVSMELWLDETSLLYKTEEVYRKLASMINSISINGELF